MSDPTAQDALLTFEKALEELEALVGRMEDGRLPLEESLAAYQRGAELVKFCEGKLADASPHRLRFPAAAVEMIHAYSLIHDDLPCMDDDVLRRGRPTCHVEFDEATALLAGDALQSLAFQVLAEQKLCDRPDNQLKLLQVFAVACGSRGMAGGQAIDLDAVG